MYVGCLFDICCSTNNNPYNQVKLSEAIRIVTKKLGVLTTASFPQYTKAIQRKFAVLSFLGSAALDEYDEYVRVERKRLWNTRSLDSITFPQVKSLFNTYKFGIDMLNVICRIHNHEVIRNSQIFLSPVMELCESMRQSKPLEYFSSWSPRQPHSIKVISPGDFTISGPHIVSNNSNASNIIFCENSCFVYCTFINPKQLFGVKLDWMYENRIGAPQRYSIFLRKSGSSTFQLLGNYLTDDQKVFFGSWNQIHYVCSDRNQECYDAVKIVVTKKLSKHNTEGKCWISQLTFFENDDAIVSIGTVELFHELNKSLFPLTKYEVLKPHLISAMVANVKAVGSLSLFLGMLISIVNGNEHLSQTLTMEEVSSINGLIDALSAQEGLLIDLVNSYSKKENDYTLESFDCKSTKSENCIILNGSCLCFTNGDTWGYFGFQLPSRDFNSIEFDIITSDSKNLKIGFVSCTEDLDSPFDYQKCTLWSIGDGKIQYKLCAAENSLRVPQIGDNIKLVYDFKKHLVYYTLRDGSLEILFEWLDENSIPIIVCEASDRNINVTVSSIKAIPCGKLSHQINSVLKKQEYLKVSNGETYLTVCSCLLTSFTSYSKAVVTARTLLSPSDSDDYSLHSWEYPFAIDVNLQTFQNISFLFDMVNQNESLIADGWIASLIVILQLQLDVLCEYSVPSNELSFRIQQGDQRNTTVCGDVFKLLNLQLHNLLNSSDYNNRRLAMDCLVAGCSIFYPLGSDRLTLLTRLRNPTYFSADISNDNHTIRILKSLNRIEEIHQLVDEFIADPVIGSNVSIALKILITIICDSDNAMVGSIDFPFLGDDLIDLCKSYLFRFYENLLMAIMSSNSDALKKASHQIIDLLMHIINSGAIILSKLKDPEICEFAKDKWLRNSLIGRVLYPLFHYFCVQSFPSEISCGIIAGVSSFTKLILEFSDKSKICKEAYYLIASCDNSGGDNSSGIKGWKTVKAAFDDGDSSYTLSDNGSLYTSAHSSNTCAIVNYRFSKGQKGAWEFKLENDSLNDECSVFGAARMPLSSRCYTSSPDLWMRRSYNGYMYCLGQTTGNSLEKIHPGDVIRIEFDGIAGTLSYSVNGSDMEIGFSGIVDDVYPACGSYRSSVSIKLLKVEVFDDISTKSIFDEFSECYPTGDLCWRVPSADGDRESAKLETNCLNHLGALYTKSNKRIKGGKWLTSVGTRGAVMGVHRWDLEFKSQNVGRFSIGLMVGPFNMLNQSKKLSSIVPAPNQSMSISPSIFAWNSDGSLWCDGRNVSKSFGISALPLMKGSIVSLVLNRNSQTLEIIVNNKSLGIAFGPQDSKPACSIPIPLENHQQYNVIFPAASIYSFDAVLEIRAGGFEGSTVLPFLLSSSLGMTSICSRMITKMLESLPSASEIKLHELLESPLFVGGLDEEYLAIDPNFIDLQEAVSKVNQQERSQFVTPDIAENRQLNNLIYAIFAASFDGSHEWPIKDLYNWLDTIDPEPIAIQNALRKTLSYNFPDCELPMLACMIKHAELENEIRSYFSDSSAFIPSDNLVLIWQKIKQLRNYLRKQRQSSRFIEQRSSPDFHSLNEEIVQRMGMGSSIGWWSVEVEDQTTDSLFLDGCDVVIDGIGFNARFDESYICIGNYPPQETLQSIMLTIGQETFISHDFFVHQQKHLVAWFDLSEYGKVDMVSMKFFDIALVDKSAVEPKVRSRLVIGAEITSDSKAVDRFEQLCNEIRAKASFLLMLRPTCSVSAIKHKINLVDITSICSSSFTSPPGSTKTEISKRKTQDRWKRVVEYLHVQSKLHRQLSSDSHDSHETASFARSINFDYPISESTTDGQSDLSGPQAAIQACAGFVMSHLEGEFRIKNICRVLKDRIERARLRLKGLQTIDDMLRSPVISTNIAVLLEFLNVLKNSIPSRPIDMKSQIHHYMTTLEGCPMSLLASVQKSAGEVYSSLTEIFNLLIKTWLNPNSDCVIGSAIVRMISQNSYVSEKDYGNAAALLFQMWSAEFSSRDSQWIADSKILDILRDLTSHGIQDSVFSLWENAAQKLIHFITFSSSEFGKDAFPDIQPWSVDKVESGLLTGALTSREVLVHLLIVYASNFDLEGDELGSKQQMEYLIECFWKDNFDANAATKCFAILSLKWCQKFDKKEGPTKIHIFPSPEESRCGCFDPRHKALNISLSDNFREATLRQNGEGTSVCVYGTISYSASTVQEVGNYFEVLIASAGEGDIGIGFANRDEFAVTGHMPGWVAHSYAYHGDDGKKYGDGASSGDWPLFEDGDIIGCGIDFTRRTIFYTRNGELLGDGFSNIIIEEYWPIVGFSNRHHQINKVRINFGMTRFSFYTPALVVSNVHIASCLASQEIVVAHAQKTVDNESAPPKKMILNPVIVDICNSGRSGQYFAELTISEAKTVFRTLFGDLERYHNKLTNLKRFSEAASYMGKFLVLQTTRSSLFMVNHVDCDDKVEIQLGRGISAFGSSKESNATEGTRIIHSIATTIGEELVIGCSKLRPRSNLGEQVTVGIANYRDHYTVQRHQSLHLRLLNQLCLSSVAFVRELCSQSCLAGLFDMLEVGNTANKLTTIGILHKLLVTIEPEVVEKSVPQRWKEDISHWDNDILCHSHGRKSNQSDIFIRKLLSLSADGFVVNDEIHPFGAGDGILSISYSIAQLLQKLSRCSQWSEIIARNITSLLRVVQNVWAVADQSEKFIKLAPIACAAATCISFKPILHIGARIIAEPNIEGIIVGNDGGFQELSIVLRGSGRSIAHLGEIEKVPLGKLEVLSASMDIANISQPVIPQLFELGKVLMQWILHLANSCKIKFGLVHAKNQILVAKIVFSAIVNLMEMNCDIIAEPLLDSSILGDLLRCASMPSPLRQILTNRELDHLWSFVQARRIEGVIKSASCSPTNLLEIETESVMDNSLDETTVGPVCFEVSDSSRFSRKALVENFARDHNLDNDNAESLLEYFMMDLEKAHAYVENSLNIGKSSFRNDSTPEKPTVRKSHLDDANIFKSLEFAVTSSENRAQRSDSMKKGLVALGADSCRDSNIPVMKLIIQNNDVGISPLDTCRIAIFDEILSDENCFVYFYNNHLDIQYGKMLMESDCKRIDKIHGWDMSSIHHLAENIDLAGIVASVRRIVMILVAGGFINACTFSAHDVDFVYCAKLLSVTSSSALQETMKSVFAALGSETLDESQRAFQKSIVENMARDVQEGLIAIRDGNLRNEELGPKYPKKKYTISSTHPFKPSHIAEGKIVGESDWKGITITFSSKCCTPGKRAKLMFYITHQNFLHNRPDFSFYGNEESKFKDFTVPDVNVLYYRFEALSRSHFPDINSDVRCGKYIIDEEVISAISNGSVGLGDDDTLFNLFDASGTSDSASVTLVGNINLPTGKWIFQVTVVELPDGDINDWQKSLTMGVDLHDADQSVAIGYFLGNDEYGFAITSDGCIIHRGESKQGGVIPVLEVGDVVTIRVSIDGNILTLAAAIGEGCFSEGITIVLDQTPKRVQPAVSIPIGWKVKVNFGDRPFLVLPDRDDQSRTVFESQVSVEESLAWGYEFVVTAVHELDFELTRDFDLVWNSKDEECSSSKSGDNHNSIWVWRPKARDGYYPVADVVTEYPFPPPRHVLIQKTQCAHPTKFMCVFYSAKQNLVVWRPIPPKGFVAMGDIVSQGTGCSTPPSVSAILCPPEWGVKGCKATDNFFTIKKVGDGKNIHNATLWRIDEKIGCGYFYGSPYEKAFDNLNIHSDFQFRGIGEPYAFIQRFQQDLDAEWIEECDVIDKPSFSWIIATLDGLLSSHKHKDVVLKKEVFVCLAEYLRSCQAVHPLQIVPLLIRMIRESTSLNVSLPFEDLKNLCKTILTEAVNTIQVLKKAELPKGLMMLVDFVVEIQAVHVVESSLKDRQAISRNMERGKLRLLDCDTNEEEKSDELLDLDLIQLGDGIGERDKQTVDDRGDNQLLWEKLLNIELQHRWWDRSQLHSHEMKLHRVIKKDNLDNLFCKESVLLKLKQVLKFLFAINGGVFGKSLPVDTCPELALERSFPKLMTSKLWYDHICSCAFFESHHPYKEKKFSKRCFFPGSNLLTITFDRRFALSVGDKLILKCDKSEIVLSGGEATATIVNAGITFSSNELLISFVPGSVETVNEEHEWGWALLVSASGPIYESVEIAIDLSVYVRHHLHQKVSEEEHLSELLGGGMSLVVDPLLESLIPLGKSGTELHDDSGSEASGPTSVLEIAETPSFHIGVATEDLIAAEIGGEAMIPPSIRPVSKRGKRDNSSVGKVSVKNDHQPIEIGDDVTTNDPEVTAIKLYGTLIKSGDIAIPYATTLDILIERSTPTIKFENADESPKLDSQQFSYVIELMSVDAEYKSSIFKVDPNSQVKCSIKGSRAEYLVFALELSKLNGIAHAAAGDGKKVTGDVSETVCEIPTNPSSGVLSIDELKSGESMITLPIDDNWSCSLCTFLNPSSNEVCEMCNNARPEGDGTRIAPPEDALWWCPQCTLLNTFRLERLVISITKYFIGYL